MTFPPIFLIDVGLDIFLSYELTDKTAESRTWTSTPCVGHWGTGLSCSYRLCFGHRNDDRFKHDSSYLRDASLIPLSSLLCSLDHPGLLPLA